MSHGISSPLYPLTSVSCPWRAKPCASRASPKCCRVAGGRENECCVSPNPSLSRPQQALTPITPRVRSSATPQPQSRGRHLRRPRPPLQPPRNPHFEGVTGDGRAGVIALLEGRRVNKVAVQRACLAGQALQKHADGRARGERVGVDERGGHQVTRREPATRRSAHASGSTLRLQRKLTQHGQVLWHGGQRVGGDHAASSSCRDADARHVGVTAAVEARNGQRRPWPRAIGSADAWAVRALVPSQVA